MASVDLRGLTKRFGSLAVVDDVTLRIDHGQLVCLLGPSGCGKTTTLRLLAGFLEPSAGEILVGDRLVSSKARTLPPEQRNMSMIFQSYALWPHMTVAENIVYGLRLRKLDRDTIAKKLQMILETTKLEILAQRYPGELSGGQQQRVALARALVVEPETLLLDEPLSNLDANLREEMRFEIRRLHDEFRYTTIYVTHDQTEAMTAADLIVVMNQGNIEQAGSPEDIYERPISEFVAQFIGGSNIFKGKRIGDRSVDCGNGLILECGSGDLVDDGQTIVSIRHHDMQLANEQPSGNPSNWTTGNVLRQVYLGSHRDYLISLSGGETVRAITPVGVAIPENQKVWIYCPPDHCRALAR